MDIGNERGRWREGWRVGRKEGGREGRVRKGRRRKKAQGVGRCMKVDLQVQLLLIDLPKTLLLQNWLHQ